MKKLLLVALLLLATLPAAAYVWHNPMDADRSYINGRAWESEMGKNYNRVPDRFEPTFPKSPWYLSKMSTGLYIRFMTTSQNIQVRYKVKYASAYFANMAALNQSGMDLYMVDVHGQRSWVSNNLTFQCSGKGGDTLSVTYRNIHAPKFGSRGNVYELFLPTYNGVDWLAVGVDEGSKFKFVEGSKERPIVAYGTSITQGASASRPGLAWPALIQRGLEIPVVNLGFSGSAKIEPEMFDALMEIDARAFCFDFIPNCDLMDSLEFTNLFLDGMRKFRANNAAPIFLCEGACIETKPYYTTDCDQRKRVKNRIMRRLTEQLKKEGYKDLYYITNEQINLTIDDFIDGVHPNDIGMMKQAQVYLDVMRPVIYGDNVMRDYTPCTQRRDGCYEWMERHNQILALGRTMDPEIVMIGNSITHFWGGEPYDPVSNGRDSWDKLFGKRRVLNMGMGWDRVENVYWRLLHGELDDCHPKHVVLMIGTNNLRLEPPATIARGICDIVKLIRKKQPQAMLHVVKIYPRRDGQDIVEQINAELDRTLPRDEKTELVDVTSCLTLPGTNQIDPSCYLSDGLHPGPKGYAALAKAYKKFLK